MKCILVGVVLLGLLASGVVASGQQPDATDPLTARIRGRIAELRTAYQVVVTEISLLEKELADKQERRLLLEGGIVELEQVQRDIVAMRAREAAARLAAEAHEADCTCDYCKEETE